jgi:signal transduction histidine kinase/ActR/RegA family two-component response regulator
VDASLKQLCLHNIRVSGPSAPIDSWQPVLITAIAGMSYIGSFTVTDVNGMIRHSTFLEIVGQARGEDFMFKRLAADPNAGLIADQPFRSLRDGRIIIPIGRRLVAADGSFQGIVVATLIPEMFRGFYKSVDVGRDGVIWVIHPTGLVFFREPSTGDPHKPQAEAPAALNTAIVRSDAGVFTATLEADGPAYVNAWHTLDEPPIVIAVSVNLPEAMRTWRRDAMLSIGLVVLVALALGITSLQLVRQLNALGAAERTLVQQDQELVEAERIAGLGSARLALPNFAAHPSPQLIALLELPPEASEITLEEMLEPLIETDRTRLRETLESCIASGGRYQLEVSAKLAEGGERVFWIEGILENAENAEEASILTIFQDVTQQRLAEQRSSQSQRLAAIGRLTGGVAHDFNNILTAIIGHSEILLWRLSQDDPIRKNVEEIAKAGHRAAELTNQLLAFSRKQVLQPKIIDLNHIVVDIEGLLRRLIGEDVELATNLSPTLGRVKADPGQIEQILMNLTINARDAMPEGGKLIIETANIDLDEHYAHSHVSAQTGPFIMLAVSDTGCGMDKETLPHIFEPFFTTKEKGKGTGLGLASVYGIVKQSGGNIWVYSEPDKGTTFKIYLPRIEEPAEIVKPNAPMSESSKGTETILLVEDETGVRKLARETLEMSGYTVLEASEANEALRLYSQHQSTIHLMITDVVMPGMSGRELAQRIAESGHEIKVLYMSGYTDDAIVHHGILDAKIPFLQKPFTPDALTRKVREVLTTASKD